MLPDLSCLHLDDAHEAADIGQGFGKPAGIRKPTHREEVRKAIALLVQDELLDSDDEDEDYEVPDVLKWLERDGAARGRVAPRRRKPEIAEEVRTRQGAAGELFGVIQNKILDKTVEMSRWFWCEPNVNPQSLSVAQRDDRNGIARQHAEVTKAILRTYVLNNSSWVNTAYYSRRGKIHDRIMPEASFRQLFNDYVNLRGNVEFLNDFSKTPAGHFTQAPFRLLRGSLCIPNDAS